MTERDIESGQPDHEPDRSRATPHERAQELWATVTSREQSVSGQEVDELRQIFSEIPGLVFVNFDNTLTTTLTIRDVLKRAKGLETSEETSRPAAIRTFEAYLGDQKSHPLPKPLLQFFYEDCLGGIDAKLLDQWYNEIARETLVNPRFLETTARFGDQRSEAKIPVVLLSLNAAPLIEKFLAHHQKELAHVEVVVVLANQLQVTDGRLQSVIPHIPSTDAKTRFYPGGDARMLCDSDEIRAMRAAGIDAINIDSRLEPEEET